MRLQLALEDPMSSWGAMIITSLISAGIMAQVRNVASARPSRRKSLPSIYTSRERTAGSAALVSTLSVPTHAQVVLMLVATYSFSISPNHLDQCAVEAVSWALLALFTVELILRMISAKYVLGML